MTSRFIKDKFFRLAKTRPSSKTMSKIKPLSKGGTKVKTDLDRTLAILEMNSQIRRIQWALPHKADKLWRAEL